MYLNPLVLLCHHLSTELADLHCQPAVDWHQQNTETHSSQECQSHLHG